MELRGQSAARALTESLAPEIEELKRQGTTPCLAVLRVGEREDDLSYERGITKRFDSAGALVKTIALDENCTQDRFDSTLFALNADPSVHGILVFRPLPKQLDPSAPEALVSPEKDVDGMCMASAAAVFRGKGEGYPPCTAQAVMELLDFYDIDVSGRRVVIVGRSLVVGRPLSMLLLAKNATVTLCHTKTQNLADECRRAEILIACAGKAGMITPDLVSPGAVLVDVGINVEDGRLCGDVSPSAYPSAGSYSPVPGGVGSVTSAVILKHTVLAAKKAR